MASTREEFGSRTHYNDEFGNSVDQPTTIATYGQPSSTDDPSHAYGTPETAAGGGQQQRRRPAAVDPDYDPTQRRGTTTGEYGRSGIGFMDRAKEKLDGVGGYKEDPGHTATTGRREEGDGVLKGLVEKIKKVT